MPEEKKADNTIRLWNAATGQELRQFAGHQGAVGGLAFLAEGKILASISADSTIRFWEIATGKERYRLAMQPGSPSSFALSPDGKILATGSEDTTALIWDVERLIAGRNQGK